MQTKENLTTYIDTVQGKWISVHNWWEDAIFWVQFHLHDIQIFLALKLFHF